MYIENIIITGLKYNIIKKQIIVKNNSTKIVVVF